MCERLAQYRSKQAYADAMGWQDQTFDERVGDRIANWNVPPGSQPWLMHRLHHRQCSIEMVNWGYRPVWAAEADVPSATSVRLDQAMIGPYFKPLFKSGRAVVPADGWYEWARVVNPHQPWFIQRKSRQPVFLAAISSFRSHNLDANGTGFILVCASHDDGLVDPREQRPIVMSAREAAVWMDPETSIEVAASVAHGCALDRSEFEWFKVTLEVNRYASNGRDLIAPLPIREQA